MRYRQLILTVTVMHTGTASWLTQTGSNSHWRIAAVIASSKGRNGGDNSTSRTGLRDGDPFGRATADSFEDVVPKGGVRVQRVQSRPCAGSVNSP
jgi:hypothetical protein